MKAFYEHSMCMFLCLCICVCVSVPLSLPHFRSLSLSQSLCLWHICMYVSEDQTQGPAHGIMSISLFHTNIKFLRKKNT